MKTEFKNNIILRKLFTILVGIVSRLGLTHSYFLDEINGLIKFGQFLKKDKPVKLFKDRYELYKYLNNEVINKGCIDYLEFGVYKGDSIKQ